MTSAARAVGLPAPGREAAVAAGPSRRLRRRSQAPGRPAAAGWRRSWPAGDGAILSHREAAALHDLRQVRSGRIDVTATSRHNLPRDPLPLRARAAPRGPRPRRRHPSHHARRTYLDLAEILNHAQLIDALEAGAAPGQARRRARCTPSSPATPAATASSRSERARRAHRRAADGRSQGWSRPSGPRSAPRASTAPVQRLRRGRARRRGLARAPAVVEVDGLELPPRQALVRAMTEARPPAHPRRLAVVRFTDDQVRRDPAGVAAELSELLRDGPWPPPARSGP